MKQRKRELEKGGEIADKSSQKTTELFKLIRASRCAAVQGKSHDVYCV